MARPVYILCCESQSVDAATGLISHFNVFNNLQIAVGQAVPPPNMALDATAWLRMTASATWMREEEDDPKQEYEFQTIFHVPDRDDFVVSEGRFTFSKPFQRIDSHVQGQPFGATGICYIESRIRKVGDQTWLNQRYPILLEVINPQQPSLT